MLPRSFKFAKAHKGSLSSVFYIKQSLSFRLSDSSFPFHFGLVALQPCRITAAQLSAIVFGIKRKIKQDAVLFLRVFPHFPVTSKPAEVRMGNGKGSVDYWMTKVRPGQILLEIKSSSPKFAESILKFASSKLPIKTQFVRKVTPPKTGKE